MTGPLAGIRVFDISQVVSGPLATQLLAEQGAEVFKIEPPGGELVRVTGSDHVRSLFANCNRGKRCLSVDLNFDAGLEILLELAATCDVFVENFRPGVTTRLGLGYQAVASVAPDIVYCSISGFGPTGPYADRAVLDPVIQALTGIVSGQVSEALPFPDLVRTLVADKATAFTAAQAITAALLARANGRGGQFLEIPMLDATLAWFWPDGMSDLTHPDPSVAPRRAPDNYQLIDTTDGQVVYFVATDSQIQAMWRVLGRDDLAADEHFSTMLGLGRDPRRAVEAGTAIREGIEKFPTEEIVALLSAAGIPCAPVLDRQEVLADPQVLHNDIVVEWEHPSAGTLRQTRPAARFASTPADFRPEIGVTGQHTDEILAELGRSLKTIGALRQEGVVT